ncbi:58f2769c-02f8-434a-b803-ce8e5af8da4a [Thermothielavioides terrestris]|uniref:58f2769c-02f8-434a-b803-ce8e5af8da4a n=1 Tax=Thermothielavioides terrestris TaxID=2587410 RepID=A0A446BSL0_9PEZI|nr:58f2769c-02f8-434a-b803-ce8e5af8da4a [Thermothielavioides terrestris]
MDPFDIPIEPIRPLISRSTLHSALSHGGWTAGPPSTPQSRRVTISRQVQIFKYIGYQYDWAVPSPFWDFLGRIASKAIFDDQVDLRELNFVAIGRREFVAYTTSTWRAAANAQKAAGLAGLEGLPPLNVIEVNFKKPQPGQPIEVTWAPARALFTAKIREWNERAGKPLDHQNPDKPQADKTGPDVEETALPSSGGEA